VDFCEHCGAKDWIPPPKVSGFTGGKFLKRLGQELEDAVKFIGGCLGTIIGIALLLGGLWLLVAIVKWMWEHS
jgi:hypothetical protein